MKNGGITITKFDAARRQLRTAIELWFNEGDPVSIHTLACAAYQIAHDLNRRKKGPTLLTDSDLIKDEYKKDWYNRLMLPASFFKHADFRKNRAQSIKFKASMSDGFILFAIRGLHLLGAKPNDEETAFLMWTLLHTPSILSSDIRKRFFKALPINTRDKMRNLKKSEFFETLLKTARGMRAGVF